MRLSLATAKVAGDCQVAGRHGLSDSLTVRHRWQQVAGNLLTNELIVRQIGIEGRNDVVAILDRLRHRIVRGIAACVGIAHHV